MPGAADTDENLMQRYLSGDRQAFQDLYRRYAPQLTGLLRSGVANRQDADDLVQETFLHLHRARRDFREGSRLRPWLMTIALNLKREYYRRRGRRRDSVGLEREPADPRQAEPAEQQEIGQLLEGALGKLDSTSRQVLELHWFAGLPFPEVATVLGMNTSAVKVRAHRAYQSLKEHLPGPKAAFFS